MRTASKNGPVPFVDGGTGRWSTVHVDDLADLYIAVLEGGTPGEAYFASNEFVTNEQLAEAVAEGRETRALDIDDARKVFSFFADLARSDIIVTSAKARGHLDAVLVDVVTCVSEERHGRREHVQRYAVSRAPSHAPPCNDNRHVMRVR